MNFMKKLIAGLATITLLTGCATSTEVEAVEEPVKVDDVVIQHYLDAKVDDMRFSYTMEDGSMSNWLPLYNDSAAVQNIVNQFNEDARSYFTTTEFVAVDEKEIDASSLVFILQVAPQENIYFYDDGHLKTVSMTTRDFYILSEMSLIDEVNAITDAVLAVQAE